jgi:predicted metallo-beta-lactamase superfamily hydrolase
MVLLKSPKEKINASQRHRAWLFQKTGGKFARKLAIADGKSFSFGKDTTLRFSEPVPHGLEGSMLGWVVMLTVECGEERFMFAPDVQGPMATGTVELIRSETPQMIMLGGPPFYLESFKLDKMQLRQGLRNLAEVVEAVPLTILEHHALRDEAWREKTQQTYAAAMKIGHTVMTAAEFVGEANTFLESKRKQLFHENPPSKEFKKWMRENLNEKSHVRPPI